MKFIAPLLVVSDLETSKAFYRNVLGLHITADFGANVTFTGGLSLQTLDTWDGFIERPQKDISFAGNDHELYFEEKDFDGLVERLKNIGGIEYVHSVKEHPWGQRALRFYDPDRHIIEVGESMKAVCKRFSDSGMGEEAIARRMDVPLAYVRKLLR